MPHLWAPRQAPGLLAMLRWRTACCHSLAVLLAWLTLAPVLTQVVWRLVGAAPQQQALPLASVGPQQQLL